MIIIELKRDWIAYILIYLWLLEYFRHIRLIRDCETRVCPPEMCSVFQGDALAFKHAEQVDRFRVIQSYLFVVL